MRIDLRNYAHDMRANGHPNVAVDAEALLAMLYNPGEPRGRYRGVGTADDIQAEFDEMKRQEPLRTEMERYAKETVLGQSPPCPTGTAETAAISWEDPNTPRKMKEIHMARRHHYNAVIQLLQELSRPTADKDCISLRFVALRKQWGEQLSNPLPFYPRNAYIDAYNTQFRME